jgi:predicted nucleic acid-binding Zn ribbon protein
MYSHKCEICGAWHTRDSSTCSAKCRSARVRRHRQERLDAAHADVDVLAKMHDPNDPET